MPSVDFVLDEAEELPVGHHVVPGLVHRLRRSRETVGDWGGVGSERGFKVGWVKIGV